MVEYAMVEYALVDAAVRERISRDQDATLFVEAGAGSGKTTVLVERIVALVVAGVPMRQIAAVTFTEKAAAELRDRVRVGLESAAAKPGEGGVRAGAALDELDGAAIGTLHAFAARILAEHPIEAGLPPLLDVRDEVASQVAFERRWADLRAVLLDDAELAPALRFALAVGVDPERQLRTLARLFDANWDLVADRIAAAPAPRVSTRVDVDPMLRRATALVDAAARCTDPTDKLLVRLGELRTWSDRLRGAEDDLTRFSLLARAPRGGNLGRKASWPGSDLPAIRQALASLREDAGALRSAVLDDVLRAIAHRIAVHTVAAARERRAEGRLEFHDLLVLARDLLRDDVHGSYVRERLRARYPRLLLDEFQDTDPIQVELAVRIAAGADGGDPDWRNVRIPAGAVFVVGDPKQSIYRFRRADITTFLAARDRFGEVVNLTTNFRATPDVLAWVNQVFGGLITAVPGGQPGYVPLDAAPGRTALAGPSVVVLGADAHADAPTAEELRDREAADVAGIIARAVREGWASLDDVTVLVPARTSIEALEEAFEELGIAYRTEATSLVYSATEVRELLLCARAVDDPTDQLALVATLRSGLCGCGDDDLWRWKAAGGRWSVFADAPDSLPKGDPVRESMRWLRRLARAKAYLSPSELLDRIVGDCRVMEIAVDASGARPRHRETWRRVRYVLDQARAWSEAEHGSLREYLAWAARQAEDVTRVSEAVLPETDADAVRIMTIHAAKGLQFPTVVVSGLSSPPWAGGAVRLAWPAEAPYELRLGRNLATAGYDAAAADERWMEYYEDLRLLYVACTRAQEHLVVSLHRAVRSSPPRDETTLTPAELLASASVGAAQDRYVRPASPDPLAPAPLPEVVELPSWADWSASHNAALLRSAEPAAVSATAVAHGLAGVELPSVAVAGLAKEPRDLELPPWAKGRYGTAVGRAVHAVLQSVDLTTADGVDDLAASLALAEGVAEHTAVIAAMARVALGSVAVRRAAARPHWKETYVGTEIDGILVEGYVDLLYREDDGTLVVVDYKTDAAPTPETIAAYETQLALYTRAITDATGERATSKLIFCATAPKK